MVWSFVSFVAELCKSYKADIVFVIDSSGSIRDQNPDDGSYDNWELLLEFMNKLVDILNIGANQVRVGAVKFSSDAESVFHLNQYSDKNLLKAAISRTEYLGGNTNTAGGIRIMNDVEFSPRNGDRPDAQNIAIVITDGVSTRDEDQTIPEAIRARDRGIQIYSVGITQGINEEELKRMSSSPQEMDRNYFKAKDFQNLERVAHAILTEACGTRGNGGCREVWRGAARRGAACCAVLCCAVLCCAVLCCAVLCCAVEYSTVQYSIVQYITVQYSTVQYSRIQ